MTTNGARLLAAPVESGGTSAEKWLAWHGDFPELDITDCASLLLVGAHADDETLGLGSLAATLGPRVTVVCATDTPGVDRRDELREACQVLGTQPPVFLGYPDGNLAPHAREMSERLAGMLDPDDPDIWVAAPWRGDGHPDHAVAGEAAIHAVMETHGCFIEYPVWMWHWAVPEDPDVPWEDAATIPAPVESWSKKRRAMSIFESQIQGDHPVLPPAVVRRALMLPELVFT